MAEMVELGFMEKIESWKLSSKYFSSKIGGVPAWLALDLLPSEQQLLCKNCKKPLVFLCQLYAPFMQKEECFHRTVFVFICKDGDCSTENSSQNIRVFRCQLLRKNKYYPYDPPKEIEENSNSPSASDYTKICRVCGCSGSKLCGGCKTVHYCSREHQAADWKAGHKIECQKKEVATVCRAQKDLLFPEFGIELEPEELEDSEEKSDEVVMKEYEELLKTGQVTTSDKDDEEEREALFKMAAEETDHQFAKFRTRIKNFPDQVIRYDRGKEPLWVSMENKPQNIPPCEHCGQSRQFEFQIMPQLLVHLKVDQPGKSIDWGTVLIYTCSESCSHEEMYVEEIAFKQDYSPSLDFLKT